jgi:hypothetical protein
MLARTSTSIPYVIQFGWEQKVQWTNMRSYAPPPYILGVKQTD